MKTSDNEYPLKKEWCFWHLDNDRRKSWVDNLKNHYSFNTIEGFWRLHNNIVEPSHLKFGDDYYYFKKGIRPMWEDEANVKGGRWIVNFDRRQRGEHLDDCWLEIVMLVIGATLTNDDDVCGVAANIRPKGCKVCVWTTRASNGEAVLDIGKKIKEVLKLLQNDTIEFQTHNSNIKISYNI